MTLSHPRLRAAIKTFAFLLVMAPILTRPWPLPSWIPPSLPKIGIILLATWGVTRWESRGMDSVGLSMDRPWWSGLLTGLAVAAGSSAALAASLYALGCRWTWGTPMLALGSTFAFVCGAVFEEIAFRGFIFFRTIEAIGPRGAVFLNAVIFAFFHRFRGDVWGDALPALSLAFASALVAASTVATQRNGIAMGLHLGWNLALAAVMGFPSAGKTNPGLLIPHLEGPAWITGGYFGPAAGIPGLLALCLAGAVLWKIRSRVTPTSFGRCPERLQ